MDHTDPDGDGAPSLSLQGGSMSSINVSSVSGSMPPISQSQMAQAKNQFDQLGKALESGDLEAAKKALNALKQNAPKGAPRGDEGGLNQIKSQFDQLDQALQSGDLEAAKKAFSAIQQNASRGGKPDAGVHSGATSQGASGGGSSSSTTSTDARDLNGDGKVTEAEIFLYSLRHPEKKQDSSQVKAQEPVQAENAATAQKALDLYT